MPFCGRFVITKMNAKFFKINMSLFFNKLLCFSSVWIVSNGRRSSFFFHSRGIYLNLLDPKFYRKFGIQVRGAIMPSTPDIFFRKQKTFLWTTQNFISLHTPNSNNDIRTIKKSSRKILNASVFILRKFWKNQLRPQIFKK